MSAGCVSRAIGAIRDILLVATLNDCSPLRVPRLAGRGGANPPLRGPALSLASGQCALGRLAQLLCGQNARLAPAPADAATSWWAGRGKRSAPRDDQRALVTSTPNSITVSHQHPSCRSRMTSYGIPCRALQPPLTARPTPPNRTVSTSPLLCRRGATVRSPDSVQPRVSACRQGRPRRRSLAQLWSLITRFRPGATRRISSSC